MRLYLDREELMIDLPFGKRLRFRWLDAETGRRFQLWVRLVNNPLKGDR